MNKKVNSSEEEWREKLSLNQFRILREKGTEPAFTGEFWNHFEDGQYICAGCDTILFVSDTKFESNCGWPSFSVPADDVIDEKKDVSHGMIRTEVLCKNCGGHLGHVFNDGPKDKGGLRYCINSLSLIFKDKKSNSD